MLLILESGKEYKKSNIQTQSVSEYKFSISISNMFSNCNKQIILIVVYYPK